MLLSPMSMLFVGCALCTIAITDALRQLQFSKYKLQRPSMSSVEGITTQIKSVGFIGLGLMGDGMARRLLSNGYPLTVWNRSKGKCDNLRTDFDQLVSIASSPAEVIAQSSVTFVMLSTPEATKEVYNGVSGLLSAVCEGKRIVDCATLAPDDMVWASKEVSDRGGTFLEGPVSGSKIPAEKGQLIFLLAGDKSLAAEVQPYLAQMGKSSHFIGEEAGKATKMKLVVNAIMSNMLACLAEGLSMSADCGLSTDVLLEVLSQGTMASPLIAIKGPKILAGDYAANFPLKHAHKDLNFAVDLATEVSSKIPMSRASKVVFTEAMEAGRGDLDFAAIAEMFKQA